jgi:phytoene dehydrogenase-like protein
MGAVADALIADLVAHGGEVRCDARVTRFVLADGRARGVILADGTEVRARHAVVADLHARRLFLELLGRLDVPSAFRRSIEAFRPGWGVFKLDWALSGPVPWADPLSGRSAVVHVTDSLDDLSAFTTQVRSGSLPDRPYLVVGQQSLADDTRAPPGHHTLYAYTHAPYDLAGGWDAVRERFADRIEGRLEALAPGFRSRILARAIHDPTDLERTNASLVGGDLGGGSNAWHHSFFLRPTIRGFRHRTPIARLYLASASSHPGAGVHGMGGWNAAQRVLDDLGRTLG